MLALRSGGSVSMTHTDCHWESFALLDRVDNLPDYHQGDAVRG